VKLDAEVYEEIVRRLVSLRMVTAELSDAYEDPVAKKAPTRCANRSIACSSC
jgi:hypothetical protein